LRDLERSIACVFVWERVFKYQFAMFIVVRTNRDTKTHEAVLRSALRLTEQRPFQLVAIDDDKSTHCAFAPFLLTVHQCCPPIAIVRQ